MTAVVAPDTPEIVVIAGPTAVGKTATAVELARMLGTEIISADSMQVYRHLSIGTAKPTQAELKGVVCNLVDCVEPDHQYNLGEFVADADAHIARLRARGRPPLVCGGTGMYLRGLLYGVFEARSRDDAVRARLAARLQAEGLAQLYSELVQADPAAAHIRPNDAQRIIRALEVIEVTGRRITELQTQHAGEPRLRARIFVLTLPREELTRRIADRADRMVAEGLLDEVRAYLAAGFARSNPAVKALGYAEMIEHVEGRLSLADAIEAMKTKTRQFSKRQMTWFRSLHEATMIDVSNLSPAEVATRISDSFRKP